MKLITKNTLVLLLVSLAVFFAGGWIFYSQLHGIVREEAMEALQGKQKEVLLYLQTHDSLPESPFTDGRAIITPNSSLSSAWGDTLMYNESEDEWLPYLSYQFPVLIKGEKYSCTVFKLTLESEDLTETILYSLSWIAGILIIVFVLAGYLLSKITWRPFMSTLSSIRQFSPDKKQIPVLSSTSTLEFRELNAALSTMMDKINADFENLKAFTENASHELQTPIAVLKGKTENLLQQENLSAAQVKELVEMDQMLNRLRRLNQTLLMLSKIENRQFSSSEEIDWKPQVEQKLEQLKELIDMKSLHVTLSAQAVKMKMHPVLADMVITNMISNAIRYTPEKGSIVVDLAQNGFKVINDGPELNIPAEQLFQRFRKGSSSADSTGLGLALVQHVAKVMGHRIHYSRSAGQHIFHYSF